MALLVGVGGNVGVDDSSSLCGYGEGVVGFVVAVHHAGYFLLLHRNRNHFAGLVVVLVGWDWVVASVFLVVGVF
jgi:hypothetical protein